MCTVAALALGICVVAVVQDGEARSQNLRWHCQPASQIAPVASWLHVAFTGTARGHVAGAGTKGEIGQDTDGRAATAGKAGTCMAAGRGTALTAGQGRSVSACLSAWASTMALSAGEAITGPRHSTTSHWPTEAAAGTNAAWRGRGSSGGRSRSSSSGGGGPLTTDIQQLQQVQVAGVVSLALLVAQAGGVAAVMVRQDGGAAVTMV